MNLFRIAILQGLLLTSLSFGQSVQVVSYDELDRIIAKNDDTTRIFNFWATWCSPCVEELPLFEKLHDALKDKPAQLYLVSLDFRSLLETTVIPFVQKRSLNARVMLLNESDADRYINKISPDWSGAIPATLMINNKVRRREFVEKKFNSYEELKALVDRFKIDK